MRLGASPQGLVRWVRVPFYDKMPIGIVILNGFSR
jgi:hypothetical protein